MTEVNLDPLRGHIAILKWAKQKKAEITELEKASRAAIEEALGDADTGTLDNQPAVNWKAHKRTALDTAALKREQPETYALYSKTTEVRRFEVLDD